MDKQTSEIPYDLKLNSVQVSTNRMKPIVACLVVTFKFHPALLQTASTSLTNYLVS